MVAVRRLTTNRSPGNLRGVDLNVATGETSRSLVAAVEVKRFAQISSV